MSTITVVNNNKKKKNVYSFRLFILIILGLFRRFLRHLYEKYQKCINENQQKCNTTNILLSKKKKTIKLLILGELNIL